MATLRVDPIPASNHSTSPPVVRPDSSVRRTARIVGVLFLAGFLTYGVGNLIATGIVRSADRSGSTALFVTGAALMLLNSAFVIGIGVLMFPILRAHNKAIAAGYLGTRIFEGVVLAIGVVSLIVVTDSAAAIHANSVSYNVAEAGLAIGSLFFCALLFRTGLVPRWLAGWGFIGYACFAGGALLVLFGVAGAGSSAPSRRSRQSRRRRQADADLVMSEKCSTNTRTLSFPTTTWWPRTERAASWILSTSAAPESSQTTAAPHEPTTGASRASRRPDARDQTGGAGRPERRQCEAREQRPQHSVVIGMSG